MKRMRLILTLLAATLLFAGCGERFRYVVNGQFSGGHFDGSTVYLTTLDDGILKDSAVVKDGTFRMRGFLPHPMMGELRMGNQSNSLSAEIVLERGKVAVDMWTLRRSGTPKNERLQAYLADKSTEQLTQSIDSLLNHTETAGSDEELASLQHQYDQCYRRYIDHIAALSKRLYLENTTNTLGAYALTRIAEIGAIEYDSLDNLLRHSSPAVANYLPLRMARAQMFYLIKTSPGHRYVDVSGVNFASALGRAVRLSSFVKKGELTLVDFWSSGCMPCRQEIADNLIRIHEDYKDKGVNVVGIDVWDDDERLRLAINQLGITYPQIVDKSGDAAKVYSITGVPTILLIGRDGTILARDLRGEEIEAAIVEALNATDE